MTELGANYDALVVFASSFRLVSDVVKQHREGGSAASRSPGEVHRIRRSPSAVNHESSFDTDFRSFVYQFRRTVTGKGGDESGRGAVVWEDVDCWRGGRGRWSETKGKEKCDERERKGEGFDGCYRRSRGESRCCSTPGMFSPSLLIRSSTDAILNRRRISSYSLIELRSTPRNPRRTSPVDSMNRTLVSRKPPPKD